MGTSIYMNFDGLFLPDDVQTKLESVGGVIQEKINSDTPMVTIIDNKELLLVVLLDNTHFGLIPVVYSKEELLRCIGFAVNKHFYRVPRSEVVSYVRVRDKPSVMCIK